MTETVRTARVKDVISVLSEMMSGPPAMGQRHGLERMCTVLGAQVGIWAVLGDFSNRGRGCVESMCDVGWQGQSQQLTAVRPYVEDGCRADPSARPLLGVDRPQVHRRSDLIADDTWYHSPFFAEARRPAALDHLIHAVRPIGKGRVVGVTFIRPLGDRDFDGEEVALVDLFHSQLLPFWEQRFLTAAPSFTSGGGPRASSGALSRREHQVAQLLAQGLCEKEVASELGVSLHTCHQYTKAIYRKLGVHNRAQLTQLWLASRH